MIDNVIHFWWMCFLTCWLLRHCAGSLAAISMLEAGYKEDMDQKEAEALVTRAISAGASPITIPCFSSLIVDFASCLCSTPSHTRVLNAALYQNEFFSGSNRICGTWV